MDIDVVMALTVLVGIVMVVVVFIVSCWFSSWWRDR